MTLTRYPRRGSRQNILVLLSGFVAIWALAGAIGLMTGVIELGSTIEDRLPFDSPVFAGVALGLVIGLPTASTAVLTARADSRAPGIAVTSGAIMSVQTEAVVPWAG